MKRSPKTNASGGKGGMRPPTAPHRYFGAAASKGQSRASRIRPWLKVLGICAFLTAITWVVFGQTVRHEFVNYDDQVYVYKNPAITSGLTLRGLGWAFSHFHGSNWHPLTTLSHMLDSQIYGLNPGGHHLTNVLLHNATVLLLFLVLNQMTGALWRSAFVAVVFAIHPLRAESVAWVAERKDVLSGFFFMLTIVTYVHYARNAWSLRRFICPIFFFGLGLMSKPMLVTLPFVLLLLDYWPLRRFGNTENGCKTLIPPRLIVAKIPMFILSADSCFVTLCAHEPAIDPGRFSL